VDHLQDEDQRSLAKLLLHCRWAALATSRDGESLASMVAVVPEPARGAFLLHLSHLALHTRYLLVNPKSALALSELDTDTARDPQTLARVSIQGRVEIISRDTADYAAACAEYLESLPSAAPQFELADFYMMRFVPETARSVPGFGRVHRLDPQALRAAMALEESR
jgi:putative heme iron utilization protein